MDLGNSGGELPYHSLRVYLSQVGYAWQPKEELQLALYLPVQYGAEPNAPSLQVLAPRARLNWSQPIDSALSGELALQLSPKKEFLSLRSGVKLLSDPLAVKFSLLYEDGLALQTDLAFAVMKGGPWQPTSDTAETLYSPTNFTTLVAGQATQSELHPLLGWKHPEPRFENQLLAQGFP